MILMKLWLFALLLMRDKKITLDTHKDVSYYIHTETKRGKTMTNKERQDVLTDIMVDLNAVGDVAFKRSDRQILQMLEIINNRVVYLWGDLDEKSD